MRFQIGAQDYYLHFAEDEGRWYVVYATPHGVGRVPLMHDMPGQNPTRFVIPQSPEQEQVVN